MTYPSTGGLYADEPVTVEVTAYSIILRRGRELLHEAHVIRALDITCPRDALHALARAMQERPVAGGEAHRLADALADLVEVPEGEEEATVQ